MLKKSKRGYKVRALMVRGRKEITGQVMGWCIDWNHEEEKLQVVRGLRVINDTLLSGVKMYLKQD